MFCGLAGVAAELSFAFTQKMFEESLLPFVHVIGLRHVEQFGLGRDDDAVDNDLFLRTLFVVVHQEFGSFLRIFDRCVFTGSVFSGLDQGSKLCSFL